MGDFTWTSVEWTVLQVSVSETSSNLIPADDSYLDPL